MDTDTQNEVPTMGMSNAEKVRRYKERKKKDLKNAPDLTRAYLSSHSFSDYIREDQDRIEAIDWVQQEIGLPLNYLLTGSNRTDELDWTENLIAGLLTSLETLTGLLNEYKVAEIELRIEATHKTDLEDPETRQRGVAEIIRLTEIRKKLDKRFRRDFPEYEVKGV